MKKVKFFTENWALVEEGGKFYMAETILNLGVGNKITFEFKMISDRKYDEIQEFENGVAIVKLDDKYGLINEQGKEVCEPVYKVIHRVFAKYFHLCKGGTSKECIVNAQNEVMCVYDRIIHWGKECEANGIARVVIDGKWGLIDSECREICKPQYDDLYFLSFNAFEVKLAYKVGIVSAKGKEVCKPLYDKILNMANGFFVVIEGEKQGCLNSEGKLIIPVEYFLIKKFENGIAKAIIEKEGSFNYHIQKYDEFGKKVGTDYWEKL